MIDIIARTVFCFLIGWVLVDWWRIISLQKQVAQHEQELEAIAKEMNWSYSRESQKISRRPK